MNTPLVSVIIPCYNVESYISECLESVLQQTSDCWEAICVNDGSTDNTEDLIRTYVEKDIRIQLFSEPNQGVSSARNMGIKNAKGKYLLCLDPDDYIAPNYIGEATVYMENHPDCALFLPMKYTFDSTTRERLPDRSGYYSTYRNLLLYGQWVTAVFRREDCQTIGCFDTNLKACEDWEFCIRLLRGERFVHISETPLYYYRVNGNPNALTKHGGKNIDQITKYIYRKHIDIYEEYFGTQIFNLRQLDNLSWANRKLPQLAHRIQEWWQKFLNF